MKIGKKIRTKGPTVTQRTSLGGSSFPADEQLETIGEGKVPLGMNTTVQKYLIEDNEFQDILGYYHRDGKLEAIGGTSILTPTKPNSNRILGLFNINRFSGTITSLRFTKSSVHRLNGASWTAITGGALSGGDYDRFQLLFVEDQAFFNNNGLNVLQKINLSADTYAAAGNARKYKYYVVSNNRIVGANLQAATNDPTEVAGSGDRNYSEWDPAVDISAFRASLIEPEGTNADDITGLMDGGDNHLIILRSKSVWLGIPQPIASTPYNFIKIDHRGCNAPYSVQHVKNGIMWYDPFLVNVFFYDFSSKSIVTVGDKIKRSIAGTLGDVSRCFSSYDEYNDEYELGIEIAGGAKIFRLSLSSGVWVTQSLGSACCISNSISSVPSTTIDGLGSTPIDSLPGTIDELSTNSIIPSKVIGLTDGDRIQLTSVISPGTFFKTKSFKIPGHKQRIERIELDFRKYGPMTIVALGNLGSKTVTIKTYQIPDSFSNGTIKIPVNRTCDEFAFEFITTNAYIHGIDGFRVYRYPAGRL